MDELIAETNRIILLLEELLLRGINENQESDPALVNFARASLHFITGRYQAILLLVKSGHLWDAEILMRPVLEATMRTLFVCHTGKKERGARLEEFWDHLWEIDTLRQSERAKIVLERAGNVPGIELALRPIILSREEEKTLREKWPKRMRRNLEQKWSFSENLTSLEIHMEETMGFKMARVAVDGYGRSSNLIHADATAYGLLWDRENRPPDEKRKLVTAHGCRLLSDLLSYLMSIWVALSHVLTLDRTAFDAIFGQVEMLFKEFNTRHDEFWETQGPSNEDGYG